MIEKLRIDFVITESLFYHKMILKNRIEDIRKLVLLIAYDMRDHHFFFPVILWNVSIHSFHTRSKSGTSFSIGPKRSFHAFLFHSLSLLDVNPLISELISLIRHFSSNIGNNSFHAKCSPE